MAAAPAMVPRSSTCSTISPCPRSWTTADRQLATRLADTWVAFAATGRPNGKGLPAWPAFDGTNAAVLRIGGEAGTAVQELPDFSLFSQGVK
jgi:para-nitrobenzyl esterase